uniref:Uncharacterized protein n=1 Tax=Megaselia scalaris TaxID=36166 RepID=T1GP79_MEGSC
MFLTSALASSIVPLFDKIIHPLLSSCINCLQLPMPNRADLITLEAEATANWETVLLPAKQYYA